MAQVRPRDGIEGRLTTMRVAVPVLAVVLAGALAHGAASAQAACRDGVPPDGPWYRSVSPSEAGNRSTRDHHFAAACAAMHPAAGPWRVPRVQARATGLPGLYNAVTREPGEVFALGGAFGPITADAGPYVVALDAETLAVRWKTRLPGARPGHWNYPGALGVHRNGDLYAAYGPRLARLDARTGEVRGVVELPVNQPEADVATNGFAILSDGNLVAKSIHRKPGCTAADFDAFLRCDTDGVAASTVAVVDPERMAVLARAIAPEHIRFRVTVTHQDGADLVYLPGDTRLHRYRWAGGRLERDAGWAVDYLLPGQTPGTAVAALGDWVVIQTNGMPARAPMSLVAISQRDAARMHRVTPFADRAGASFIPSLPTIDPDHRRIHTFDGFVGEAASVEFDPVAGLTVAWRVPQRSFAFSMLAGPPQARVWIGTDVTDRRARIAFAVLPFGALRMLAGRVAPSREALVWRDARSGAELGRLEGVAAVGGGAPVPGYGGVVLLPDLSDGSLVRAGP
jgi:hypothetical protein